MIVDALLDLLVAQSAEGLLLEPGRPPALSKAGQHKPLSMPPLEPAMLREVIGAVPAEGTYVSRGRTFSVVVQGIEPDRSVAFWVPGSEPVEAEVAEPAEVAVSVPRPAVGVASTRAPAGDPGLDRLLARARTEDASDVFLSTGRDARLRIGGDLVAVPGTAVDAERLLAFVELPATGESSMEDLERTGSVDRALVHQGLRYRVNVFRQLGGLAAALRPIRCEAPTLAQLGLPEDFHRLVEFRSGMVLMTGTAGSGKSTTLVALLERINRTQPRHVITIEDPIEYEYEPAVAMIHQREVGRHVASFSAGLRAALRESPDVILLGEMRDRDTIAAALTAAETGHLVLSTLHCADAAMAIDRIIDVFPEHQQAQVREQLASVLRAVVTQVLVPSTEPPRRVPVFERMVVNTAVATKIRERRGHQIRSELYTGQAEGMIPVEMSLARLVRQGRVSRAVARSHAHDPKVFDEFVNRGS